MKVIVLLLRAECNSFPIPQRDKSRVVFTLQDTVAYSNGAGIGPRGMPCRQCEPPLRKQQTSELSPRFLC